MKDVVTMQRRLSLVGRMHKMTPAGRIQKMIPAAQQHLSRVFLQLVEIFCKKCLTLNFANTKTTPWQMYFHKYGLCFAMVWFFSLHIMTREYFSHYWPFVKGFQHSPVCKREQDTKQTAKFLGYVDAMMLSWHQCNVAIYCLSTIIINTLGIWLPVSQGPRALGQQTPPLIIPVKCPKLTYLSMGILLTF